jgi:cytochrome P450
LDEFLGGANLLTGHTDGHWKALRKGVAPAFSVANMKYAFDVIRGRCDKLVSILNGLAAGEVSSATDAEGAINVDNLLLRESMDVIGRVGFERDMGALDAFGKEGDSLSGPGKDVQVMIDATQEVVERIERPFDTVFKAWTPKVRHGHALMAHWQAVVSGLLKHIKAVHSAPGSFCNLLLKVKDPKTGAGLTDAQMTPEIAALFFAGIDTTGHTGTWALYLLSQHPDVEAKILAELDAAELLVTPERPDPRPIEWGDLARLVYLQAFIKEVLRLYPPVGIGQMRICHSHDLSLAGGRLFVPRGTSVWVPHHAMHNAAHNWDEPEAFKPERWLAGGAEFADRLTMPKDWYEGWADDSALGGGGASSTDPDLAGLAGAGGGDAAAAAAGGADRPKRYFPFAEGPRNCVGQSLAMVTLPTTLALLLSRFHFRLADSMGGRSGVEGREQYTLVTGIRDGMMMVPEPRPGVVVKAAA